jgi:translation elongation factor aEF-1 beta
MAIAALTLRIMPDSLEADINLISDEISKVVEKFNAKIHKSEIEEVAFGLKSIVLVLAWPDQNNQDDLEIQLNAIKGVGSVEFLDCRRAIG